MAKNTKKSLPKVPVGASRETAKRVNLALQGGGSHGAFSWGVLDQLIEDGRIDIEGISGCSAGSMNAVVYAYGKIKGNDAARQALHDFWLAVSNEGQKFSIKPNPFEKMMGLQVTKTVISRSMSMMSKLVSPYLLNPSNINPLLKIIESQVDFEELRQRAETKLFLSATNVRTGRVKVFDNSEVSAAAVMASACLPEVFQAVEIDGESYWDGGYMGNPVLFPLFYHTQSQDVLIVHINPIERETVPKTSTEISNRLNEITFNSAMMKELRAIGFVQKLMDEGWIKDEFMGKMKYVLLHSLRAEDVLCDLTAESKSDSDWAFLTMLRDRGREHAAEWLDHNFQHLGVRSSVNVRQFCDFS